MSTAPGSVLGAGWIALSSMGAAIAQEAARENESTYYRVEHFSPPEGVVLEIGGLDFLSSGRLVVSTRRGQVWLVDGALADDVSEATYTLFAEGLNEGLGLTVVDDEIYVVQRGELSRLVDEDGDDRCDRIDTLSDDWGLSGNYHEFAFGLPRDDAGNFYVALNVGFWSPKWWHGKSAVPYRGWALRIAPDGTTEPVACGFRSPSGLGRNAQGEIFVTDNQGDWMASSPIFHLKQGAFYGHPASLDWTPEYRASKTLASEEVPPARAAERTPAALWIPYDWSRSTGNLVADESAGAFGPFGEQMFVAELTNGMVLRALLEKVRGEYQGACIPFRQQIGSVCRIRFGPEGSLFAGLTNRGWGGLPPGHGLARVRWNGVVPFEMHGVHLLQDGFEVRLTKPLAADCVPAPEAIDMIQYDYNYWWEYGSPEQDRQPLAVTSVEVAEERTLLRFRTPELTPAMVVRCRLNGLVAADGSRLLHEEFAYTINQLPEGPRTMSFVAKLVEPPPARDTQQLGWLRLTWGDALDGWQSRGWELCNAQLDVDDPRRFSVSPGVDALVNSAAQEGEVPSAYISKSEFGDCELSTSFMLPEGGNSGIYMMGRYEVQLLDSEGVREPGYGDCGGIYRGPEWEGSPPSQNLFKRAGVWHELELEFRAPRFDAAGNKVENARFSSVTIDGTRVQEDVEIPEPTLGAVARDEVAKGPIVLQGDHGPVAFGSIAVRPAAAGESALEEGWTSIFNGEDLNGWQARGEADWEIDGETLIGSGGAGFLLTEDLDYANFDLRARVKISDGGNSGLFGRASIRSGELVGYEAEINSSFPAPEKTGSLTGLAAVRTQLLPADSWFDYELSCRDEPSGVRVTVRINGIAFNDYLDPNWLHASGHIGIEQHHQGSVVELKDIQVRRR